MESTQGPPKPSGLFPINFGIGARALAVAETPGDHARIWLCHLAGRHDSTENRDSGVTRGTWPSAARHRGKWRADLAADLAVLFNMQSKQHSQASIPIENSASHQWLGTHKRKTLKVWSVMSHHSKTRVSECLGVLFVCFSFCFFFFLSQCPKCRVSEFCFFCGGPGGLPFWHTDSPWHRAGSFAAAKSAGSGDHPGLHSCFWLLAGEPCSDYLIFWVLLLHL